jgi:hypothetical protein
MKTQEKITGQKDIQGNDVPAVYIPRLTDQRVTFAIFFQDYLRGNKHYRMNMNLVYGTGFPFGVPDQNRNNDLNRIPSYRRVDIGFNKVLIPEGLKKRNTIGDLILPIAAIRGEGTSNDYFPAEVPALPAFALQKAISTTIRDNNVDYWTGTVYTTNRRVWEHDDQFKEYLTKIRAYAIDMETATIFTVGFYNKIPTGALLLVSDSPMIPEGVKTEASDSKVTAEFVARHLHIGVESLKQLINNGQTVRHLQF